MTDAQFKNLLNSDSYQVFVFSSPCAFPATFAHHAWFVINNKGIVRRWEIIKEPNRISPSYGYLYQDFLPPTVGMSKFNTKNSSRYEGTLVKMVEEIQAGKVKEMIQFIEQSHETYPLKDMYHILTGPNSNTYPQWVLDHFPEFKITLPFNCYGKNFKKTK